MFLSALPHFDRVHYLRKCHKSYEKILHQHPDYWIMISAFWGQGMRATFPHFCDYPPLRLGLQGHKADYFHAIHMAEEIMAKSDMKLDLHVLAFDMRQS